MQSIHSKKHRKKQTNFALEYEHHIQALVYIGAAFLVIIVGLRGLGNLSQVPFIPDFVLDIDGKIEANIVMVGLLVEFIMLCLLAAVSYFGSTEKKDELQSSIERLSTSVTDLARTVPSEVVQKLINSTQETASAAGKLISEEIEILNNFRTKLDEKIVQIDQDIIQVRKSIAQGIIDTSGQMESLIKKEKETVGGYNRLIENLIEEAKESLRGVSQNISTNVKKTFDTSAEAMTRQEKMITRFYSINSKLLSEAREGFTRFIDNYSELVERESQRLQQLGANQLRPEEFMMNLNKTNQRLIEHLENIDNSLKMITNEPGALRGEAYRRKTLFQRIFKWRELVDETH